MGDNGYMLSTQAPNESPMQVPCSAKRTPPTTTQPPPVPGNIATSTPSRSALCVVRTVMSVVPLCVCVQICGSLSLQTLVQNVPRCDVMCCDVQCCAVLCCVVFRRAVCNQIVILRFVETHRRPPVDVQTQLDELPKASWDLLCSLCFLGGKARRHNGTKA